MRLEFYIKNGTEFPIVCQLIQMIIPTSPNTSPVQRGYSMLKIIFKKEANLKPETMETMENMLLLAC